MIWILSVSVALSFGIINGMWLEMDYDAEEMKSSKE
ncbi:cytochrome bd-I oxidase subunit CydX [Candidatus Vallotia lariciata]